jgi:hypothetical protein
MIKNPGALPAFLASGFLAFLSGWQQWGLRASVETMAGCLVFIALIGLIVSRSPRLSAAMANPDNADAFNDWLKLTCGAILVIFGLVGIGAGGVYILVGLAMLLVGGVLVSSGRRGRADRRWRRPKARLFMGAPARRDHFTR